jgi:hypothetical protein
LSIGSPRPAAAGWLARFGYEKENNHYEVGVAAGERVLLPQVRKASEHDLIIADGFSCQEQVLQQTGRTPLHTAQVLQLAIHGRSALPAGKPEAPIVARRARAMRASMLKSAAILGFGVVTVLALGAFPSRGSAPIPLWRR